MECVNCPIACANESMNEGTVECVDLIASRVH